MKAQRLVIVGGVAAGASAAAKARRTSETIEILLLEAGPYISFANCGLPYYVGQEISRRESLFVTDEKTLGRRFNIEVRTRTEAIELNAEKRSLLCLNGEGRREELSYDALILATGTVPIKPAIPGLDRRNVFTVRTVPDVDKIVSFLSSSKGVGDRPRHTGRPEEPKNDGPQASAKAVVMGGGYIGLETAEQLLHLGLDVTVIERAEQLMVNLDPEMALPIKTALVDAGARVVLEDGLQSIIEREEKSYARTESGQEYCFDMGILALGVRPNVKLAEQAGLELGDTGAISVDAGQRTSDRRIYAAGDNCEVRHFVLDQPVNIPLAGPANKMGRVAGANAALDLLGAGPGDVRRMTFRGLLGTAVVRVCGKFAAVTGLTETQARQLDIPHEVTYMFGASHAGYYPGAEEMILKIIHDRDSGRILGGQGVGGDGVDKRVDVIATAICGGMTVEDFEHLDLCYAPPVGSAKDVPIMTGFAGANMRRRVMPALTPSQLFEELEGDRPPLVIDVRTNREFSQGHLPDALNIPVDDLRDRLAEIPKDRAVVVHCLSGYRSYVAQRILMNLGWTHVRNLQGGYSLIELTRRARNQTRGGLRSESENLDGVTRG